MSLPHDNSQTTHVSATQYSEPESSQGLGFNLLDSRHPGVLKSARHKQLVDKVANLHIGPKTRPIEPVLQLPSSATGSTLLDPEDPLSDSWRRTLWYAFQNYGRIGIEWAIYEHAKSKQSNAHWSKILADEKNGTHYILLLLQNLTDDAIRSIIRGTLIHDTSTNPQLFSFVKACMKPRDAPSIYGMYAARTTKPTFVPGGQSIRNPDAGKWLTPVEARQLLQICRDYYNDAPNANAMNRAIERFPTYKDSRDILDNATAKKVFREWMDSFEEYYCANIDPIKQATMWTKVPLEVGFAMNTANRLGQHRANKKTSYVFAIVHAALMLPQSAPTIPGFGFPEAQQLELFPLWNDNEEYAQMGEIVASLLGSSYSLYGGLNPAMAGTASLNANRIGPDKFNAQARALLERMKRAGLPDVETDRLNARKRALQAAGEIEVHRKEKADAEEAYQAAERDFDQAMEKLKDQHRKVRSLKKTLAAKQASESPWTNRFRELTEGFVDETVANRFTRTKIGSVPGSYRQAMDLEGVSDAVRSRVETQRQANRDKARQKLEAIFGTVPASEQQPDQHLAISSEVIDLTHDVNEELDLTGEDVLEDNGPEDETEWGLPGFTSR
ncbi:MAG: hypothetical protein Q9224_004499 [Gallowayella concinna]